MNSEKIYSPFLEKLNNSIEEKLLFDKKKEKIHVIIMFDNEFNRNEFIVQNPEILKNPRSISIIPAISAKIEKPLLIKLSKNNLIKRIEEDQKLYLSILEIITILNQPNYRKSQISYTGKNVIIGIIDNGINQNFESIYDLIEKAYTNFDLSTQEQIKKKKQITHGTLMANIIGNQYLDYNDNIIGIAPDARIVDFNISKEKDNYYFSDILGIFDFIIRDSIKIDILLIPFSTIQPSDGKDILSLACNLLVDKGILIVCPAGNFGPESYTIGSPSAAENVITIGALDKEGKVTYYSGRGPTLDGRDKPDLCLPGSRVEIPLSNEVKVKFSGTSVAASIGAGMIALLRESNPNITQKEIIEVIRKNGRDLNYDKRSQGFGTLDIIDMFKGLDLYHEKVLPYNVLIKRSILIAAEITIFFIILFCLSYFLYYFNIL